MRTLEEIYALDDDVPLEPEEMQLFIAAEVKKMLIEADPTLEGRLNFTFAQKPKEETDES